MKFVYDEKTNSFVLEGGAEDKADRAEMEMNVSGTLNKITNFEIGGVPLGAAAIGGTAAIVIDRVLLERIDPQHKYGPLVMLGASLLLAKFGRKYFGKAAEVTSLILAYEAIADYISLGIDKVWPVKTNAAPAPAPSAVEQAQAVARQAMVTSGQKFYESAFIPR